MENQKSVNEANSILETERASSPHSALEMGTRRELRFRAWDKVKSQWIEGGYGFHILGEVEG